MSKVGLTAAVVAVLVALALWAAWPRAAGTHPSQPVPVQDAVEQASPSPLELGAGAGGLPAIDVPTPPSAAAAPDPQSVPRIRARASGAAGSGPSRASPQDAELFGDATEPAAAQRALQRLDLTIASLTRLADTADRDGNPARAKLMRARIEHLRERRGELEAAAAKQP